jgi:hypothetical protein
MRELESLPGFPHIFLDNDCLQVFARRLGQLVIWERYPAQEDIEHQRNALEAQQVISAHRFSPAFCRMKSNGAYRLAGISILSSGGTCFPSTTGRSESVVYYWLESE